MQEFLFYSFAENYVRPVPKFAAAPLNFVISPINWLPVMRAQHVVPKYGTMEVAEQLSDRHEIAGRLGHLLAFHLQEAVVHPITRHHVGVEAATGLRHLVLVMREDEV